MKAVLAIFGVSNSSRNGMRTFLGKSHNMQIIVAFNPREMTESTCSTATAIFQRSADSIQQESALHARLGGCCSPG